MKKGNKIKNFLFPQKENNYKPRLLENRNAIIFGFLIIIFFTLSTLFVNMSDDLLLDGQESAVLTTALVDLTNQERSKESNRPLNENDLLNQAAEMKLADMISNQYFGHISPSGIEPKFWLENVGYNYSQAGENLAVNFDESIDVANAWLNSPSHRANLIKSDYTEIGTAVGTGLYEGKESTFVVQLYANPDSSSGKLESATSGTLSSESNNIFTSSNFFTRAWFSSSNNQIVDYLLLGLFLFVFIILLLNIFIEFKIQHKNIIINALILIFLILILWFLNNYLVNKNNFEYTNFEYTAYDF